MLRQQGDAPAKYPDALEQRIAIKQAPLNGGQRFGKIRKYLRIIVD